MFVIYNGLKHNWIGSSTWRESGETKEHKVGNELALQKKKWMTKEDVAAHVA